MDERAPRTRGTTALTKPSRGRPCAKRVSVEGWRACERRAYSSPEQWSERSLPLSVFSAKATFIEWIATSGSLTRCSLLHVLLDLRRRSVGVARNRILHLHRLDLPGTELPIAVRVHQFCDGAD